MNPLLKKLLSDDVYHNMGIAPIEHSSPRDYNRLLESLSPTAARDMKRKFRKLWRSIAKQGNSKLSSDLGLGASKPTKQHKNARKREVHRLTLDIVIPVLNKINARDDLSS